MEIANKAKKAKKVIIDVDGKRKYIYGPQKYRQQWQLIPECRDWLRPSKRSSTEAFCIYCDRHLKANRKSLINHAQSKHHLESLTALGVSVPGRGRPRKEVKPVKYEDDRYSEEASILPDEDPLFDDNHEDGEIVESMPGVSYMHDDEEEEEEDDGYMVTEVDPAHMGSEDDEQNSFLDNSARFSVPSHIANGSSSFSNRSSNHRAYNRKQAMAARSAITTHVLDTMHGVPATNIAVSLFRLQDEEWTLLATDLTNNDGRCEKLIVPAYFVAGRYKLHFFVEEYFKKLNIDYFYPFVEIVFDVKDATEHYHVPILLNAFGYTTYRGS